VVLAQIPLSYTCTMRFSPSVVDCTLTYLYWCIVAVFCTIISNFKLLVLRLAPFASSYCIQVSAAAAAAANTGFTICNLPDLKGKCTFNHAGAAAVGVETKVGKCTSLVIAADNGTFAVSMHMYPGMVCCFSENPACPCKQGSTVGTCYATGNRCVATPAYIPHFLINNTATESGTLVGGKGPVRSFNCYQGDT
jgi:hypothetical protein